MLLCPPSQQGAKPFAIIIVMVQSVRVPAVILKTGADTLRRQIDLLELRIEAGIHALNSRKLAQRYFYPASDALRLDTETYYTVAHDLLGVIGQLVKPDQCARLKKEATYKTIRRIRSALVRHSFDKPDGDPYPGFGFGGASGVQLRTWNQNPPKGFRDPGFYENRRALHDLLHKYAPNIQGLTDDWKAWFAKQCKVGLDQSP
jgi:hypothetical protein